MFEFGWPYDISSTETLGNAFEQALKSRAQVPEARKGKKPVRKPVEKPTGEQKNKEKRSPRLPLHNGSEMTDQFQRTPDNHEGFRIR